MSIPKTDKLHQYFLNGGPEIPLPEIEVMLGMDALEVRKMVWHLGKSKRWSIGIRKGVYRGKSCRFVTGLSLAPSKTKKTLPELLYRHLSEGGEPLTSRDVAKKYGVSQRQVHTLFARLESRGVWDVEFVMVPSIVRENFMVKALKSMRPATSDQAKEKRNADKKADPKKEKNCSDKLWITPTGRPAEDEPHLARAVYFRRIWPAHGRASA